MTGQTRTGDMTGPLVDTKLQGDRYPLKDNEREHTEILDRGDAIIAFMEEGGGAKTINRKLPNTKE